VVKPPDPGGQLFAPRQGCWTWPEPAE